MRLGQSIRLGAWLLVGMNLLMAMGSIAIFMRMAPAITVIIDRNERSLLACENMLASLAVLSDDRETDKDRRTIFVGSLERAKNNVTELAEPAVLTSIESTFAAAFQGNSLARQQTVDAIVRLGKINRAAMVKADRRAQQLGLAGAWGVVFMAGSVFFVGMIFIRNLTRRVVNPLEEIHAVILAHRNGETRRRCTCADLPQDLKDVFNGINEILDKSA